MIRLPRRIGTGVPQLAVLRDLCSLGGQKPQVSEYRELWHPTQVRKLLQACSSMSGRGHLFANTRRFG